MTGESSADASNAPAAQPLLRVVSGNPTPEELAALITVIAAASSADAGVDDESDSNGWGSPAAMHRVPMPAPSPDSWRQLGRR